MTSSKDDQETHNVAFVSYPIESHWHPYYGPRFAGFPVNICYAGARPDGSLISITYVFDPGTFVRGSLSRRMDYFATNQTRFLIRVAVHDNGRIETFKYCDSQLILEAQGPDFQTAMIQTTICGLTPEEINSA